MLVPETVALEEIAFTQMKSNSYNFVAEDQVTGKLRKKAQKIEEADYNPKQDVQLTTPFKIWNPLTW